jgi:hypothetical protein
MQQQRVRLTEAVARVAGVGLLVCHGTLLNASSWRGNVDWLAGWLAGWKRLVG